MRRAGVKTMPLGDAVIEPIDRRRFPDWFHQDFIERLRLISVLLNLTVRRPVERTHDVPRQL